MNSHQPIKKKRNPLTVSTKSQEKNREHAILKEKTATKHQNNNWVQTEILKKSLGKKWVTIEREKDYPFGIGREESQGFLID